MLSTIQSSDLYSLRGGYTIADVASDTHTFIGDTLNKLIDQGNRWAINPLAAAATGGSAFVAYVAGRRGYGTLSNHRVLPTLGWSAAVAAAADVLYIAVPRILKS